MYRQKNEIKEKAIITTENIENARLINLSSTLGFEYEKNISSQGYKEIEKDPASRKLFITSIDTKVTDSLMESILQELGEMVKWKRNKNAEGVSVGFGIVEFENVKGVLNCLRILKGFRVYNSRIDIKMGEKAKLLIAEYVNEIKKNTKRENPDLNEEEIDKRVIDNFSENDNKIMDKIDLFLEKFGINREKIVKTEGKSSTEKYTEEKLILQKKKYGLINEKELDAMFEKELEDWLIKEDKWEKEREEEIIIKKNKNRKRMEYLEEELRYDDLDRPKTKFEYEEKQKQLRLNQWKEDKYKEQKKENIDIQIPLNNPKIISHNNIELRPKKEKNGYEENENVIEPPKSSEFKIVISSINKEVPINNNEELKLDFKFENQLDMNNQKIEKHHSENEEVFTENEKENLDKINMPRSNENNLFEEVEIELKKRSFSHKMKEDQLLK
jgi:hypothetical protein